jgi:hypothetical protein
MTTSSSTFPQRLSKVDDLTRPDHSYLTPGDDCYFLGEYTARKGFAYSGTNNLIYNFKKSLDKKDRAEFRYKERDINRAALAFRAALQDSELDVFTFVPIPPSKAKNHPLYDDRITRMLRSIRPQPPVDVRELILQVESTAAVHETEKPRSPEDIEGLYAIDEGLAQSPMNRIAIVDDVLTTGAHFRAAKSVINRRFPGIKVIGLFIARRVPDTSEVEDLRLDAEDLPF